jgi:CRP/FNR family transcriptional regulator, dissimilatory nitrate respiration regulator
MDILSVLKHIPLFQGLPAPQLELLAGCAKEKSYKTGQAIFLDAQEAKALYVLIWGKVKIYKTSNEGREQTIFVFGPGEPFCMTALVDEITPASAMALEDTRIVYFPSDMLEDVAKKEPSLLFNMMLVLIHRLKESLVLIESLSLKEIPQRVAAYVLTTLEKEGTADIIELSFSQRELAKILGTIPETLSRVFKKMANDGILRVENRTITVIDRAALKELAEPEEALVDMK